MRRLSAVESSLTVYSGRFGRGVSAAGAGGVMRGISAMRAYDTRAGVLPRQSPSLLEPSPYGRGQGEGAGTRAEDFRRGHRAPRPPPDPLPQGEGDRLRGGGICMRGLV